MVAQLHSLYSFFDAAVFKAREYPLDARIKPAAKERR
jgi:hypothetical protein